MLIRYPQSVVQVTLEKVLDESGEDVIEISENAWEILLDNETPSKR